MLKKLLPKCDKLENNTGTKTYIIIPLVTSLRFINVTKSENILEVVQNDLIIIPQSVYLSSLFHLFMLFVVQRQPPAQSVSRERDKTNLNQAVLTVH
jgi:hypothetical protein